ncbi:cytochrome P450, partial [Auricularia subglabra TFB-10046 SS5]
MLSSLPVNPYYAGAALVALYTFIKLSNVGKREKDLPPGPPTAPVLGNLHLFPKEFAHYKFTEWAREYGEVYSLKLASGTAIVLTSIEAVKELMDRRSATTVDRPANFMADRIADGKNMVLARYTEDWRALRRTAHAILTPQACAEHVHIQLAESSQVLYDMLHEPERFYTHLRRNSSSIIMSVLFGRRAPRFETTEVTDFFHVQHLWEHALEPGAHPPVDLIPILGKVPERWASWKTLCREVRRLQRKLYFGLLEECENRLKDGKHTGCFLEEVIERREEFGLTRELAGYLGGVLLEGGSDTTSSYLQTLVLALISYPDVQRKAQEEIDRVVGRDRAPTLDDFVNVPYIQAISKELHRWRPVAPLCIPHGALSDERYKGYLIPKDSTIFINNWGIFHDENLFENAEAFEPERFVKNEFGVRDGVDTKDLRENLAFGYGRRICPGIHLAKNSIAINVMRLIWAFNYEAVTDPATGEPEVLDTFNYAKGILTCPEPFKAKITPRSKQIADIINHDFQAATSEYERYEDLLSPEDKAYVQKIRSQQ